MCEVQVLRLIRNKVGSWRWAHGFCRFLVEFLENVHFYFISVIYSFSMGIFSPRGWVRFLYFAGVISKHIIVLFFFAVFELTLSR